MLLDVVFLCFSVLARIFGIEWAPSDLFQIPLTSSTNSDCRCTSNQPCWPSPAIFSRLQSKLSQPLIHPRPTASPCYPPWDSSESCSDVTTLWNNTIWRASQPGSMGFANWEAYISPHGKIDACFLNTSITRTCEQGRVPVVGVDARSVADVQAAVEFAVEHNLKLVVKNTGHDYMGRSAAPNSFVVWTHNMKSITFDVAFVPQGGPKSETFEAVTLGAGVLWYEAYAAASDHGRIMVGGGAPSVGAAGGWLLGGGHSPFSPHYGLGVDNALEFSVVLSTGKSLTTNAYQHPELFWALRGGGGGTYGIVTSVTYRTHPAVPVQFWAHQAFATDSSVLQELVEGLLGYQTQFTEDGWGGYSILSNHGIVSFYYAPNMTNETATRTTQGWINIMESLKPRGVMSFSTTSYHSSWFDLLQGILTPAGVIGSNNGILTSRLLSRDTIASNSSQVAQLLIGCNAILNMVGGGRVSQIDDDSTGVNPAWRNAISHAVCTYTWNDTTSSTEIQGTMQQAEGWVKAMRDATPNDGAYFNEASPFEIDWQKTFFGSHYSKLKSIKDKYDPHRLFVVHQGVGSEDWNDDLTCRR